MVSQALHKCDACGQPMADGPMRNRDFWYFGAVAPRGISPSNIDGIYHDAQHGRFLVLETKRPAEAMKRGQEVMLRALSAWGPVTVAVLRGASWPHEITVLTPNPSGDRYALSSVLDVRVRLSRWFDGGPF